MKSNAIDTFRVQRSDFNFIGRDLQRPECILAEKNGTLWAADARGGVTKILPDGTQTLITQEADNRFGRAMDVEERFTQGTLPNGLAFSSNGDFLIANFGTDALEVMTRDGKSRTLYDTIDGQPIGKVNFVLRDSKNRIWLTISTRIKNWMQAIRPDVADGYIALVDGKGIRVAADGFKFTNEIRFDAKEEFLYVVETCGRHISRLRVSPDGVLTGREIFGPSDLGLAGTPRAALCAPIRFKNASLGVLCVARIDGAEPFAAVHTRALQAPAEHCGAAIVKDFHYQRGARRGQAAA